MRSTLTASLVALAALLPACQPRGGLDAVLATGGLVLPEARGFAAAGPVAPGGAAVVARRGGETIRVALQADVAPERAAALIDEQWAMIRSLHEPQRSPYPEVLTAQTSCPGELQPREQRHAAGRYWHLYAGDRLGFGVCSRDQLRFSAGVVLLHCPAARAVARVEAFVPGADQHARVDALLAGLRCR